MKRLFLILTLLQLGLTSWTSAADLNLEIAFAVPRAERTTVVIAYDGLFPIHVTEVAPVASSIGVSLIGLEPGPYQLYLSTDAQIEVSKFPFTLNEDGSMQFQAAPGLQQNRNTVIIGE